MTSARCRFRWRKSRCARTRRASPDAPACDSTGLAVTPATLIVSRTLANLSCRVTSSPSPSPTSWQRGARFCPIVDPRSCGAGGRCLPRREGTSLCVRLVEATDCPSPFPSPHGRWHQANELSDTRECVCGCTPVGAAICDGLAVLTTHSSPNCESGSENGRIEVRDAGTNCISSDGGAGSDFSSFAAVRLVHSEWHGVVCNSQPSLAGSASATGGTIICCQ